MYSVTFSSGQLTAFFRHGYQEVDHQTFLNISLVCKTWQRAIQIAWGRKWLLDKCLRSAWRWRPSPPLQSLQLELSIYNEKINRMITLSVPKGLKFCSKMLKHLENDFSIQYQQEHPVYSILMNFQREVLLLRFEISALVNFDKEACKEKILQKWGQALPLRENKKDFITSIELASMMVSVDVFEAFKLFDELDDMLDASVASHYLKNFSALKMQIALLNNSKGKDDVTTIIAGLESYQKSLEIIEGLPHCPEETKCSLRLNSDRHCAELALLIFKLNAPEEERVIKQILGYIKNNEIKLKTRTSIVLQQGRMAIESSLKKTIRNPSVKKQNPEETIQCINKLKSYLENFPIFNDVSFERYDKLYRPYKLYFGGEYVSHGKEGIREKLALHLIELDLESAKQFAGTIKEPQKESYLKIIQFISESKAFDKKAYPDVLDRETLYLMARKGDYVTANQILQHNYVLGGEVLDFHTLLRCATVLSLPANPNC